MRTRKLIEFNNKTVQKMLEHKEAPEVFSMMYKNSNKINKILNDPTLTDSAKLLEQAKVIEKEMPKFRDAVYKAMLELEHKYNEFKSQTKVEQLRSKPLTADQKLTLPMIKEHYDKTREISDNDDFKRGLLLLADTGLVKQNVIDTINLETDKKIFEAMDTHMSKMKFLGNYYKYLENRAYAVAEDPQINSIKKKKYISEY